MKKLILLFSALSTLLVHGAVTGQLFFRINQGNDVQLGDINTDATGRNSIYFGGGNTSGKPQGTFAGNETSVAVDTAAGLVFSVGVGNAGSYDAFSVHNLNTGALISTTEFGPNTGNALNDDVVQALAINPFTHTLYVDDWGGTAAVTGVREYTYNPANGALTPLASNGGFLFTESQISSFVNADAIYLDIANNRLYYVNDDSGYNVSPFSSVNGVCVVNISSPTSATQLTSNGSGTGQFPVATGGGGTIGAHGNLIGLTVDVADGIVFFESTDALGSANIALWWVSATGGGNQTATKVTLPAGVTLAFAGQSNEGGDAAGLSFDAQTRQIYLSNANNSTTTPDVGSIYVLQWNNASKTVSLVTSYDTATLVGTNAANVNTFDAPSTTTFDDLPLLSGLTGTATHAGEQGAAVTLLSATPTTTDSDGGYLASATIQITGGTFVSNEASANDDHLFVLDGATHRTSGVFTGTSITVAYSAATEKLTLTGYDTIAHYNTALGAVQYNTTGENPSNYGNNPTRTISWTVSDGALGVPFGAQNSGSTTLTIDAVNNPPTNTVPGSITTTNQVNRSISGLSITDVDASPSADGMTVNLLTTNGTLTVQTGVAGGLVSGNVTGNGTANVTLNGTQNAINTTFAAANGLLYQANTSSTNDTLKVTTSDNGHTGSGGAMQDQNTVAITIYQPPAFTSANAMTFKAGSAGTFTVVASAFPAATFVETGALPNGIGFNTNSGVLSGTPATGTGGVYPITFKAHNMTANDATQSFTLTVNEAPNVNCPSDITTNAAGYCSPSIAFASSTGGFPAPTVTYTIGTTVITSPYAFPVGTNIVTTTAANVAGTNSCSFTVNVVAGAAPKLNFARAGTNVVISWTNSFPCYALQFAPSISSNSWSIYPGPFATNGGLILVTNAPPFTNRFFRLAD